MNPLVSILVLNYNGQAHLEPCFTSLAALDYPPSSLELVLVDNASADDSLAYTRSHFPHVTIIQHPQNYGFCRGYNLAAQAAQGEYLVFLNNDTHVEAGFVRGLLEPIETFPNTASTASKILSWDGEAIDFVGGLPTFYGHSWQRDFGQSASLAPETPDRLLFGCAASLLVRRETFLETGGFDEDYFAFFEDMDLGWRLNLLGHDVRFAPEAVTYHRFHGSFDKEPYPSRLVLYERNALLTIFKNYEEANLRRVLPCALLACAKRAWTTAGLDPTPYTTDQEPSQEDPDGVAISREALACLLAVEDFVSLYPNVLRKREWIQQHRRRSDEELVGLFPEPLRHHELGEEYEKAFSNLIEVFQIRDIFSRRGDGGTPR